MVACRCTGFVLVFLLCVVRGVDVVFVCLFLVFVVVCVVLLLFVGV